MMFHDMIAQIVDKNTTYIVKGIKLNTLSLNPGIEFFNWVKLFFNSKPSSGDDT